MVTVLFTCEACHLSLVACPGPAHCHGPHHLREGHASTCLSSSPDYAFVADDGSENTIEQ